MRFIIITKKQIIVSLSVILSLTVLLTVFSLSAFAKTDKKLPIYSVESDIKRVAITFDAAWGNEDTETLISILDKYKIKATFFLVGFWVDKYPESVKAIYNAGHDIGNHSNTHPHLPKMAKDKINSEIATCNEKIKSITGCAPNLFRPPYGDYNNTLISAVIENKMFPIQWTVDSKDWMEGHTADDIYNDVINKVCPGAIILFHNAAKNTPEALPKIIEKLLADGYTFQKVDEMIYKDNYKIDNTGKQIPIK